MTEPEWKDDTTAEEKGRIDQFLATMAKELGLEERFFHNLISEPEDWSFVIKAHALLESAVCTWLAAHFGKPELQDVFARRMMMRARIGMLRALKLGDKEEWKMLEAFGELRNFLVHNVKQTAFTFEEFFKDASCLNDFRNDFVIGEDADTFRPTVAKYPRQAMWTCVVAIAAHSFEASVQARIKETHHKALEGLRNAVKA
jgi:hypothetical protein